MHPVNTETEHSVLYRSMISLCLFIILMQWILPWTVSNDWLHMFAPQPIMLTILVSLIIGIMRLPSAWNISFLVVICAIALLWIFSNENGSFSISSSIDLFISQFKAIASNGLWMMSEQQRTLLLVIGWVMLAPALQAMILYNQLSISILITTIVYLTTLHISIGMDVFQSMLLTIISGLALIGITAVPKLRRKLMISSAWYGLNRNSIASITLFVCVIAGLAYATSYDRERSQKPLPMMTTLSSQVLIQLGELSQQASGVPIEASNHSVYDSALSGFSKDDSSLGLPLNENKTILFTGWSPEKRYWRADAKSYYNGRGWIDEDQKLVLRTIPSTAEEIEYRLAEKVVEHGKQIVQQIEYKTPMQNMPFMKAGQYGVVSQLTATSPEREVHNYILNEQQDTLLPPTNELLVKQYEVTSWLPSEDINYLSRIEQQDGETVSIKRLWEEEGLAPYLQLPDRLPARVTALASEISGGGLTSQYDRVKATEQYLKSNYKYSTKSELPKAGEDFVDDFLFQQKSGYCVHFSSAMVVMLRSQQIPARWVKGFTSGIAVDERVNAVGVKEVKYEVSQADAHAWVEVYFPEVGWIPFDPTPGASEEPLSLLDSVQKLWLEGIQTIASSVTWVNGLITVGVLTFALFLYKLTKILGHSRYRRQYAAYYDKYIAFKQKQGEYIAKQEAGQLPPRTKASYKQMEQQRRLLQALHTSFCYGAETALKIPSNTSIGAWSTWREHIALIGHNQSVEQQKRLHAVLSHLEQLHYATNGLQAYEWPHPKEWNKLLKLIVTEHKSIKRNEKGNTWRMKLQWGRR